MQSKIYNELRHREFEIKVLPVIRTAVITLGIGFFGAIFFYHANYPITQHQRQYINAQEQLRQVSQQIAEFNHNHNL